MLSDPAATHKLLRVLAYRMRHHPPTTPEDRSEHQKLRPPLHDLWSAYHEADHAGQDLVPEALSGPHLPPKNHADAHREAVALVLNSPRSTREVLRTLAARARDGQLASGEHSGTVAAATDLLNALSASRTHRSGYRPR
ncbi:hypothetical protein ACIBJI_42010 [Nocardia sp. NPDC050408]|uniref:hypothetical protein n=1 Tax=Nocardia sp. NPDC050408 TaxID=3364319 RepID=UPI0037978393